MAQGRTRRLATRLLRCVWAPVVSFVLVVAVAMACAVWSPVPGYMTMFDPNPFDSITRVPDSLSEYDTGSTLGASWSGLGITFYFLMFDDPTNHLPHQMSIGRSGIPFRCLRWTNDVDADPGDFSIWARGTETGLTVEGTKRARRIPLMPEPIGMVLNVLIVSAAIVLLRLAWRRVVVFRRRRKSLCITCAYPLGDFAICPECGKQTGREA